MRGVKATLRVLSAEAEIMNNLMKVDFAEKDMQYQQKADTIISGRCPGILPLSIIRTGGKIRAMYNTEGYIRLASLKSISAAMILTIAERVLECTELCRDYLLFPEEYVFSADTVYISEDFRNVKLAYIPRTEAGGETAAISSFIYSLKPLTTENGRTYLDTLGSVLECRNLRISRVIGFVEQLKQEINICGIE